MTKELDEAWSNRCNVNKITFPFGYGTGSPILLLCKKKPTMNVPAYCVLLFWQNHFYQYSIPFHESDIKLFGGEPLNDILLPPFLFHSPNNSVYSTQQILKMGSSQQLKWEKEVLRFEYDCSIPLATFDPVSQ